MPARGPIPGKRGDASARIAALIRDLDQINVQQMSPRGAAYPGSSPLVYDLVALGDAAVPPLLAVLESDNRLTRSIDSGGGMSPQRFGAPRRRSRPCRVDRHPQNARVRRPSLLCVELARPGRTEGPGGFGPPVLGTDTRGSAGRAVVPDLA